MIAGIHRLVRISTDRTTATVASIAAMALFGFSQYRWGRQLQFRHAILPRGDPWSGPGGRDDRSACIRRSLRTGGRGGSSAAAVSVRSGSPSPKRRWQRRRRLSSRSSRRAPSNAPIAAACYECARYGSAALPPCRPCCSSSTFHGTCPSWTRSWRSVARGPQRSAPALPREPVLHDRHGSGPTVAQPVARRHELRCRRGVSGAGGGSRLVESRKTGAPVTNGPCPPSCHGGPGAVQFPVGRLRGGIALLCLLGLLAAAAIVRGRLPDRDGAIAALALLMWAAFGLVLLMKIGLNPRVDHYGFYLALPATVLVFAEICWLVPGLLRQCGAAWGRWDVRADSAIGSIAVMVLPHIMLSQRWYRRRQRSSEGGRTSSWPPRRRKHGTAPRSTRPCTKSSGAGGTGRTPSPCCPRA